MVLDMLRNRFPLLLPYGLKCLAFHLVLYVTFRSLLPSRKGADATETLDDFPWKISPSMTAHKIVAFSVMIHWTFLGFQHLREHDYSASSNLESEVSALVFVPAGFDIAQYAMGALLLWDIPLGLCHESGRNDVVMHVHHLGMVVVTSCVLGLVGPSSVSSDGIVGTHVAPIFLGAIELSSIPLQIVDLFHPKKSPHWNKFANDGSSTSSFSKFCATINETSRIFFAILFLLVRGLYFPYVVATIAAPDFYVEGSVPSMVLLSMSILFTLLQMYWANLVLGQVKKTFIGNETAGNKKYTSRKKE